MKRDLGIYVGDADGTKGGSLILNPTTGAINVRLDCIKLPMTDQMLHKYFDSRLRIMDTRPISTKIQGATIDFEDPKLLNALSQEERNATTLPLRVSWTDLDHGAAHGGDNDEAKSSDTTSIGELGPRKSSTIPLGETTKRNLRSNSKVMFATALVNSIAEHPFLIQKVYADGAKVTVGKALNMLDAKRWIDALQVEINQMVDTGTLQAIDSSMVPSGSTVINSTMVLKKKPDKYKARLCACGNELKGQISETYSPTIGALTYATVHQIAIIDRMKVRIIDTIGAFLYQDYPQDQNALYVRMPAKVMEACSIPYSTLYRVKKYIYGLPDSGLAYYRAYSQLLTECGYKKSRSDPCLFLKVSADLKEKIYIWIHVDDTFCAASSEELLDVLERDIKKKFNVTVNKNVESYIIFGYQL